jgi:acetoin utilization deacetylase AcuC-like enzyme
VSVAAELAIRTLGVRKVMIIDWDVHHGNGTAEIFRHRRDVLVANIHQSGLFRGTGAMADIGSATGRDTPSICACRAAPAKTCGYRSSST